MTHPDWKIKLERNGNWWTWNAARHPAPYRYAMHFIPRRSKESAIRAANRPIARIDRRGFEDGVA